MIYKWSAVIPFCGWKTFYLSVTGKTVIWSTLLRLLWTCIILKEPPFRQLTVTRIGEDDFLCHKRANKIMARGKVPRDVAPLFQNEVEKNGSWNSLLVRQCHIQVHSHLISWMTVEINRLCTVISLIKAFIQRPSCVCYATSDMIHQLSNHIQFNSRLTLSVQSSHDKITSHDQSNDWCRL